MDIQTSDIGCKGVKGTVTGRLEMKYHGGYGDYEEEPDFAFIKDFYVHRSLLKKYNISCVLPTAKDGTTTLPPRRKVLSIIAASSPT